MINVTTTQAYARGARHVAQAIILGLGDMEVANAINLLAATFDLPRDVIDADIGNFLRRFEANPEAMWGAEGVRPLNWGFAEQIGKP